MERGIEEIISERYNDYQSYANIPEYVTSIEGVFKKLPKGKCYILDIDKNNFMTEIEDLGARDVYLYNVGHSEECKEFLLSFGYKGECYDNMLFSDVIQFFILQNDSSLFIRLCNIIDMCIFIGIEAEMKQDFVRLSKDKIVLPKIHLSFDNDDVAVIEYDKKIDKLITYPKTTCEEKDGSTFGFLREFFVSDLSELFLIYRLFKEALPDQEKFRNMIMGTLETFNYWASIKEYRDALNKWKRSDKLYDCRVGMSEDGKCVPRMSLFKLNTGCEIRMLDVSIKYFTKQIVFSFQINVNRYENITFKDLVELMEKGEITDRYCSYIMILVKDMILYAEIYTLKELLKDCSKPIELPEPYEPKDEWFRCTSLSYDDLKDEALLFEEGIIRKPKYLGWKDDCLAGDLNTLFLLHRNIKKALSKK